MSLAAMLRTERANAEIARLRARLEAFEDAETLLSKKLLAQRDEARAELTALQATRLDEEADVFCGLRETLATAKARIVELENQLENLGNEARAQKALEESREGRDGAW